MALYNYDEVIQEKLYQFKGCFDIELATIFIEYFKYYLKLKYHMYIIVPAPSYKTKNEERGFNHVVEIFKNLDLPIANIFEKTQDVKQSSLSVEERQNIGTSLNIIDGNKITGKKVLVVDDVYTTGSTVKAMINKLKLYKPKQIQVLVLSKTINPNYLVK